MNEMGFSLIFVGGYDGRLRYGFMFELIIINLNGHFYLKFINFMINSFKLIVKARMSQFTALKKIG